MRNKQKGIFTVEFAIVGALLVTLILSILQFGLILYTWNCLDEATRRGARIAAVCVEDSALVEEKTREFFPNPTAGTVTVSYPNGMVRVRVDDYTMPIMLPIPGLPNSITAPGFETTIPAESLGFGPVDTDCGV